MKYIIALLIAILVPMFSHADCSDETVQSQQEEKATISSETPAHQKGRMIVVVNPDGSTLPPVPMEKFKIVPRKQQYLVTKVTRQTSRTCSASEKNRVSLIGGYGPKGTLDTDRSATPGSVTVESQTGVVGGLQYQRKITNKLSVGVQGQTNQTGSLLLGLDF